MEYKLIIKNKAGIGELLKKLQGHNRQTLLTYWQKAYTRKYLLIIRCLAPMRCQVVMMPPQDFDVVQKRVQPRYFNGSLTYSLEKNLMLVFGTDEVLAQIPGANQPPPSGVVVDYNEAPREEDEDMAAKKKAKTKGKGKIKTKC